MAFNPLSHRSSVSSLQDGVFGSIITSLKTAFRWVVSIFFNDATAQKIHLWMLSKPEQLKGYAEATLKLYEGMKEKMVEFLPLTLATPWNMELTELKAKALKYHESPTNHKVEGLRMNLLNAKSVYKAMRREFGDLTKMISQVNICGELAKRAKGYAKEALKASSPNRYLTTQIDLVASRAVLVGVYSEQSARKSKADAKEDVFKAKQIELEMKQQLDSIKNRLRSSSR